MEEGIYTLLHLSIPPERSYTLLACRAAQVCWRCIAHVPHTSTSVGLWLPADSGARLATYRLERPGLGARHASAGLAVLSSLRVFTNAHPPTAHPLSRVTQLLPTNPPTQSRTCRPTRLSSLMLLTAAQCCMHGSQQLGTLQPWRAVHQHRSEAHEAHLPVWCMLPGSCKDQVRPCMYASPAPHPKPSHLHASPAPPSPQAPQPAHLHVESFQLRQREAQPLAERDAAQDRGAGQRSRLGPRRLRSPAWAAAGAGSARTGPAAGTSSAAAAAAGGRGGGSLGCRCNAGPGEPLHVSPALGLQAHSHHQMRFRGERRELSSSPAACACNKKRLGPQNPLGICRVVHSVKSRTFR